MAPWAMPPKIKIYEALSAVADGRVTLTGPTSATVRSSTGEKLYHVAWSHDLRYITADDPASRWQGYLGYPIIAVLLQLGKISYDPEQARLLAGIPWRVLNTQFKRNYEQALAYVMGEIERRGGRREKLLAEVERVFASLEQLRLERSPR
uniref:Hypothetical conserved protein n=1 Tax=uncultured prokaryote TaxID=198431 RepID=H5S982_9ZZZZ|nr:hypothetical conserved protein [uncultured prokaryote]